MARELAEMDNKNKVSIEILNKKRLQLDDATNAYNGLKQKFESEIDYLGIVKIP